MTAIIDYGVGNLFSLCSSFSYIGNEAIVTSNVEDLRKADRILLPGVGAFEDAAQKLFSSGLVDTIYEQVQSGKPFLGICLGMQLLFDESLEYGKHKGLGLIKGVVKPIIPPEGSMLKVPQIGWNSLQFTKNREKSQLFKYIDENSYVYFVHSYFADECDASVTATTDYGIALTAAVECGNVFGTQFHPEKSGEVGLNILRSFCEM